MQRRFLSRTAAFGALAATVTPISTARADTPRPHRMSFHICSGDPVMMNVALHNIIAAAEDYGREP